MTRVDSLADRPVAPARALPARRSGRGLAAFALLLALSALGLAGYPYYRQLTAPAAIDDLDALRVAQQRQADELQRVVGNSAEIESQLRRQQQRLDESAAAPPMRDADVDTLGADARGATRVEARTDRLSAAKRQRSIAGAARRHRRVDAAARRAVVGESSRYAGASDGPRRTREGDRGAAQRRRDRCRRGVCAAAGAGANGARSTGARCAIQPDAGRRGAGSRSCPSESTLESAGGSAWQKFRSLFEFRREGGTPRPPLGPDEAAYLRMNLALQLQIAELALLRNDAPVYQQSLGSVRRWLDDYLDPAAAVGHDGARRSRPAAGAATRSRAAGHLRIC